MIAVNISISLYSAVGKPARHWRWITPRLAGGSPTGMIGAAFGPWLMNRFRIAHPVSRGLALGTISHGQGTAEAATESGIHRSGDGIGRDLHLSGRALPSPSLGWVNGIGMGDAPWRRPARGDSASPQSRLRRGRGQFPPAVPKLPVNASPLRPKICKCRLARRAHDLNFQKFLRLSI